VILTSLRTFLTCLASILRSALLAVEHAPRRGLPTVVFLAAVAVEEQQRAVVVLIQRLVRKVRPVVAVLIRRLVGEVPPAMVTPLSLLVVVLHPVVVLRLRAVMLRLVEVLRVVVVVPGEAPQPLLLPSLRLRL